MTIIDDSTPVFLRGNGRPVTEERTVTELVITGSLPAELDGRYVRNGANPLTGVADHPFFGDGMVHGVRLRDGQAEWYRNRYVQTPFISNPDIDILDPAVAVDMKASKANTNVIGHAGKIFALEEGHLPYVLDGDLNTVGPTDFDGALASRSPRIRRSARSPVNCSRSVIRRSSRTCATTECRPTARWCRTRTSPSPVRR